MTAPSYKGELQTVVCNGCDEEVEIPVDSFRRSYQPGRMDKMYCPHCEAQKEFHK